MMRETKPVPAALGFRVKSGWAMAVLLAESAENPQLVICRSVLLSDPNVPQSKQPYHAALELSKDEGKLVTKKLTSVVRSAAAKSVQELLKEARALRYDVRRAALVVGSLVDPATLHNEHIRAHGLEGQLFRTVLEDALGREELPCRVLLEKKAYASGSELLAKTEREAKRMILQLGKSHQGSWRAEQKLAALAAWVALQRRR